MTSRWKDCPKCFFKVPPCVYCGSSGSVPLCPPMSEGVVYRSLGDVLTPMIVDSSELGTDAGGQVHAFVSGYVFASGSAVLLKMIPGPQDAPGHWNWRGEPS